MRADIAIPIYDEKLRSDVSVTNGCAHVQVTVGSDQGSEHRLNISLFGDPSEVARFLGDITHQLHLECAARGVDIDSSEYEALAAP